MPHAPTVWPTPRRPASLLEEPRDDARRGRSAVALRQRALHLARSTASGNSRI